MRRRVLLGFGVVLVALGAWTSVDAVLCLRDLRQVRILGQPLPRTAQEDYARNPYWLNVFAKLDAIAAGALLTSGTTVLLIRQRCRR